MRERRDPFPRWFGTNSGEGRERDAHATLCTQRVFRTGLELPISQAPSVMNMVVVAYLWWRTHVVANLRKLVESSKYSVRGTTSNQEWRDGFRQSTGERGARQREARRDTKLRGVIPRSPCLHKSVILLGDERDTSVMLVSARRGGLDAHRLRVERPRHAVAPSPMRRDATDFARGAETSFVCEIR